MDGPVRRDSNFTVERMAAGGVRLQIRALSARRHRSPRPCACKHALAKGERQNDMNVRHGQEAAMRLQTPAWLSACLVLLLSATGAAAQGTFQNLNFEQATIVPDPSSQYYPYAVYASNAVPGWTPSGILGTNEILYNDISLGATSVSLCGLNSQGGTPTPLDGAFSIDLYGGGGIPTGASISQTGLVPANAASIRFIAQRPSPIVQGILLISLGGQNIPFSAISTESNYTTYGGNIASALAGQIQQLTFTAPNGGNNYWEIDDIQFSTQSVPEPGVFGLFALGAILIGWRVLERRRCPRIPHFCYSE